MHAHCHFQFTSLGNSNVKNTEVSLYVKALEDCGFQMHMNGQALLLHLGLTTDEVLGLQRQFMEKNIVVFVTAGINKIITKRKLTWENVIDGVKRYEPNTASEMLEWFHNNNT